VPPIRAAEPTVMLQWWGMQKCQTGRAVVCVDYRFNREEDGEIAGGSEWVWATTKAGGDPSLADRGHLFLEKFELGCLVAKLQSGVIETTLTNGHDPAAIGLDQPFECSAVCGTAVLVLLGVGRLGVIVEGNRQVVRP
jgi:hypothetical protein